jgi:butyryl-CoA dehydrogenase
MGLYIPPEYGGMKSSFLDYVIAIEELSRACIGVSVSYAANALGSYAFILFGTEAQKKKYLPDLAAGKTLAAFGLTEANAGSDAGGIQTTAVKKGDKYILNVRNNGSPWRRSRCLYGFCYD